LRNVKIATAIIKFIIPLISYATPSIASRSFMIKPRRYKTLAFMRSETSQRSKKYKGSVNILSTGRTKALRNHSIIPQMR
jgi:hypothetical protein